MRACCTADAREVLVAVQRSQVVGFVAVADRAPGTAEIDMLAVDPGSQRRGVGALLTRRALDLARERGADVVVVETGGDPGHAPARATYGAAGFTLLPVARYFRLVR